MIIIITLLYILENVFFLVMFTLSFVENEHQYVIVHHYHDLIEALD